MINVRIKGVLYPILFDLYAMELLDESYGDARDAINAFRQQNRKLADVKKMFQAMANSARNYLGEPEDVTGKEMNHCTLTELNAVVNGILEEMKRSSTVQAAGGSVDDDEHHDIFKEEMDAKNGTAGGASA